jgi:SAM-dependent methyltransferase
MASDAVRRHYGTTPLWDRVHAALTQAGLDGEAVAWPAFAPLDEFHTRGLSATRELADALSPARGDTILDVGSGLGGPARLLAADYGCDVTGIDLSSEFVDVANRLTERTGLSAQVRFQQGDATRLPFTDAAFDHAWTQHVAMNIADRSGLYEKRATSVEARRTVRRLRRRGRRRRAAALSGAVGAGTGHELPAHRSADSDLTR